MSVTPIQSRDLERDFGRAAPAWNIAKLPPSRQAVEMDGSGRAKVGDPSLKSWKYTNAKISMKKKTESATKKIAIPRWTGCRVKLLLPRDSAHEPNPEIRGAS